MATSLRILIVEDSADDAELLIRALRKGGYAPSWKRVETAEEMSTALGGAVWDIVISDYELPGFSGLAALKLLQDKGLDLPFLIVSGKIGEAGAVEIMKAGAHDYLPKENLARLVPAIQRELTEARRRREHRQAVNALYESEARYRRLVESVTDYIYSVKVEDGRPVATSHGPGCVAVTGYTSEEYDTDPGLWYRMVHEEDRQAVADQAAVVLSGIGAPSLEHRIVCKDERVRWVKNRPVPHYDAYGRLVAYDGLVSDITERRTLENQLHHAQKMEAIGTLSGGIAHDFNNILTAVIGYASLLEMKMDPHDPLTSHVGSILSAADRAAGLTQSLLAFGRKQAIEPRLMDLNQVVQRVEKLLARLLREDIDFSVRLSEDELTVMADAGQVEQVLMNLATNARDAMQGGGRLTLSTSLVELDHTFQKLHGYGEPGRYALLTFSDTGRGMDEATRQRIFEPFFTTKEVGKGTGLGLAIAYGIIKQHNGYIGCYSEPGHGTTFTIHLPILKGVAEYQQCALPPLPMGGTETILLAEDDPAVRVLCRDVLEEFGYTVIEAVDGEDAVRKFAENRASIQLLVADVIMPKKNGREVYEEITRLRPGLTALFTSGYSADVFNHDELQDERFNFLAKPIAPSALLQAVRDLLDH